MSGEPLILAIELQLCLVVASTLNGMRKARKAAVVECSGTTRIVESGRRLPSPVSMPYGFCDEARSPAHESSVPARRARIVL